MTLVLLSRTIIALWLFVSNALGVEIASVENENVTLGWNIDSRDPAQIVNINHPSDEVIFYIADNKVFCPKNSEYIGRWKFVGNQTSGKIDFVFMGIKQSDAGNYTTQIGSNPTIYGVTLVVYLKPEKPIITVVKEPVVSSLMVVSCSSQSTSVPRGHNSLTMKYEWYIDSSKLIDGERFHSNGNQLSVPNVTKHDDGLEIMCVAKETIQIPSENSSAYRITVKYGPGSVTLFPCKFSYTLLEIKDTLGPIRCISDCNPDCTYQWRRDGTYATTGAVLLVHNITHEQAGAYNCKATNKYNTRGEVSSTVNVLVEYAPVNTSLSISAGYNVNETTMITFECTTESVPNSTLQLMYQRDDTKFLKSGKNSVKSAFKILRANCLDTGKYFCIATNKLGRSVSDKIDLNVLCSPRRDERVNVIERYLVGNDKMDITGTFIANPKATISWHFQSIMSNESTEVQNNTNNFQFFVVSKHVTCTSRAVRTNMEADDFGQYVMIASNAFGKDEVVFHIEPQQTTQPEGNYILVGATGGILIPLSIVIITILHMLKKRSSSKKGDDPWVMSSSAVNIEGEISDVLDDGMKPNIIYESAGPNFEQQFQIDGQGYSYVTTSNEDRNDRKRDNVLGVSTKYQKQKNKPGIYINVKEQTTSKTVKGDVYSNAGCAEEISLISSEDLYANSETQTRLADKSTHRKNKDDLVYVDVEYNGAERNQEEVIIHGINNRNNYAEILLSNDIDENGYNLLE